MRTQAKSHRVSRISRGPNTSPSCVYAGTHRTTLVASPQTIDRQPQNATWKKARRANVPALSLLRYEARKMRRLILCGVDDLGLSIYILCGCGVGVLVYPRRYTRFLRLVRGVRNPLYDADIGIYLWLKRCVPRA
jgi:hypothetical protein